MINKYSINNDVNYTSFALSIAKDIVDELNSYEYDDIDLCEFIYDELDTRMIYFEDQWELMKTYQHPDEANLDEALEMCFNEIYSLIEIEDEDETLESDTKSTNITF